jgi:peptide/nickel transport system permease protein
VVGVSILTFVLTALTPGDPARTILGTQATPEAVAAINEQLGLDDPLIVQYGRWLSGVAQGDLGRSLFTGESVVNIIANTLPVTLTLIGAAVVISLVIGVVVGVLSARRRSAGGQLLDALSLVGYAIPPFFLGLLLVVVFANGLRILPASGWGDAASVVLPVATLALAGAALVARQTRQGMVEVLDRDFVTALRARGVSEFSIVYRHGLRNALGNVLTLLGLFVVSLLLGSTLVETVFAIQGLGSVAVRATSQHDLPVLEGAALAFTLIVVVAFVIVDLARAWLNPKLRSRS